MQCSRCGAQNSELAVFCVQCGRAFDSPGEDVLAASSLPSSAGAEAASLLPAPDVTGLPPSPQPAQATEAAVPEPWAAPEAVLPRAPKPRRRWVWVVVALAGGLVLAAGGLALYFFVFRGARDPGWIAYQVPAEDDTLSLWLVRPDGSDATELVTGVDSVRYAWVARNAWQGKQSPFSPAGSRMVFLVEAGDQWTLYTHVPGQKEPQVLLEELEQVGYLHSPDGAWIGIATSRDEKVTLQIMKPDGQEPRLLADGVDDAGMVFLRDSRRAAFITQSGDTGTMYVLDLEQGGPVTVIEDANGLQAMTSESGPIAYAVKDGDEADVYLVQADGTDITLVAENLPAARVLGVAPDAANLLVRTSAGGSMYDLTLLAAQGGGTATLVEGAEAVGGWFMPTGSGILYWSEVSGQQRFWLSDDNGEKPELIAEGVDGLAGLGFTPDLKTLFLVWSEGGQQSLDAVSLSSRERTRLWERADGLGQPLAVGDDRVLIAVLDGELYSLCLVPMSGDRPGQESSTALAGGMPSVPRYDLSPDGRRIVYNVEDQGVNQLYVVDSAGKSKLELGKGTNPVWGR